MPLDQLQPLWDRAELLAAGVAAVVVASQVADHWVSSRARASGASRTQAKGLGRDAGMVTILVAVLVLAVAVALGWGVS